MIEKIEALQEKLEAKTASLAEAYEYVSLSEMTQFKYFYFEAIELALWIIVKDLSEKRPTGKKIKTFSSFSDKDIETIFYPISSKDTLIERVSGIYFDTKLDLIVCTDRHILVAFLDKTIKKRSGFYKFNKLAKEPTTDIIIQSEVQFVDYINVIPRYDIQPIFKEIDLLDFYAFLNQFLKWGKIARKNGCDCFFYFDRIKIFEGLYNIELLFKIVKALIQVGEKKVRFDFWAKNKAAILGGSDNMALIMPIESEGSLEHDFPITY